MARSDRNGETLEYKAGYEKSPSYRHIPINGVWGQASGSVVQANFFFEQATFPTSTTHAGNGIETGREPGPTQTTRTLEVGISMDFRVARSIAQWILEKAEEAERFAAGDVNVR